MNKSRLATLLQQEPFTSIARLAGDTEVYVIGGYVRDVLLGREVKDLDFVVSSEAGAFAEKLAEALPGAGPVTVFKNFGTAMFRWHDCEIEFVAARKESYQQDSRNPQVASGSFEEDRFRRDFTINALSVRITANSNAEIIDPFNGLQDLGNKIIRTPGNPDLTFSDDPLRMMRAIRFASQLGFEIESASWEGICRNAHRIGIVSRERISDELNKILMSALPGLGFIRLNKCRLLEQFFPALVQLQGVDTVDDKSHKDNFYHTMEVLDNVAKKSSDLWLRWAALLHDIAKPATKKFDPEHGWTFHGHDDRGARMVPGIFQSLKLPRNEKMKFVQKMVLLHLRPIVLSKDEVTDSAVRRLLFDAGDDIDALMSLCEADITTKNAAKMNRYLRNYKLVQQKLKEVEEKDRIRNWQPPVSGEEIMELYNLVPGPLVGKLKTCIRESILDGIIPNQREDALQLLNQKAEELGIRIPKIS